MLAGLVRAGIRFVVIGGVAARAQGSVRITEDLDVCYATDPDNLDRLSGLLALWHAYPRGVERGLPFVMDRRTLQNARVLNLTTDEGDLDLFDVVAGIGEYEAAKAASVEVEGAGVRFLALGLGALIKAKRAAGRPKDLEQIPELEALRELARTRRQ
jgi:hypothetical protein